LILSLKKKFYGVFFVCLMFVSVVCEII